MKPIESLQQLQYKCDQLSFSIHNKHIEELSLVELLNHKCYHLANLVAKVSRVCEQADHGVYPVTGQIEREVIPDLIVYALQLANKLEVDVTGTLLERYQSILFKHGEEESQQKLAVIQQIAELLT